MTACDTFKMYYSLKFHFNEQSYDYFKYNGQVKNLLMPLHQEHIFKMVGERYSNNLEDFYVSNFLVNPKLWVNDLLTDECDEIFREFKKKKESLTYVFKNDVLSLADEFDDLNLLIKVNDDFPILLKKVFRKKIQLETLLILNFIVKFLGSWENQINDDIIWPSFKMKCYKYYPFIKFDSRIVEAITKDVFYGHECCEC